MPKSDVASWILCLALAGPTEPFLQSGLCSLGWSRSLFKPGPPKTSIQQAGWGHIHPIAGQAYLPFSVFLPSLPGGTSAHQASEAILGAGEGTPPFMVTPLQPAQLLMWRWMLLLHGLGSHFPSVLLFCSRRKKKYRCFSFNASSLSMQQFS